MDVYVSLDRDCLCWLSFIMRSACFCWAESCCIESAGAIKNSEYNKKAVDVIKKIEKIENKDCVFFVFVVC